MKKIIYLAAFATTLLVSCSKEETNFIDNTAPEMVPFEVTLENELASDPETKAWLNASDLTIKWASNDEFSVYDGVSTADGGLKFTVNQGGSSTSCKLSGEISSTATGPIYFMYPYQVYAATRGKNNNFKTNISNGIIFPVEASYNYQTGPASIPVRSLMLVGKMPSKESTDPVTMKTPMGFVKFHLDAGETHPVTKIELTYQLSGFIAGTVAIDCTGNDPAIIMQGSGTGVYAGDPTLSASQQLVAYDIIITPKNADTFPDGDYYFALPPKTYTKGIRMKFTDDMGCVAQKAGSSDLVVTRAKVKDLGTIVSDNLEWYETIDLRFLNAVTVVNWPFNETKVTTYTKNVEYTFTYGSDKDAFKFKSVNYDTGLWGQTGLNIQGNMAYLQIPGRTGKKIHNVALRVGAQGANCGNPIFADTQEHQSGKYHILTTDGTFEWLTPGNATDNARMNAWWGNKQYGWQKQWTDFDATGECDYRIYLTATKDQLKVINLLVQYVDLQ